jgi:dihydrofolate synthase / folylpolyglutamate synthase
MNLATVVSDYPSALDFLLHRINYERTTNIPYRSAEFKLDRMRRLLSLVGDPHLGLAAAHIAGTKGKGSTAAMMAAVLQAAGNKTGLYTSPHLERIEERIAIDGQICRPEEFASLAAEIQPAVERVELELPLGESLTGPTFFEITTAMAFLHFARAKVDVAVLEVGLGGRLDSTNVCLPEVCIIPSISLDHVKQLGGTLALIAGEKAGIIKPGVPVISGVLEDEPRDVIAARAATVGAPLVQRGIDYEIGSRGSGVGSRASGGHHSPLTTHLFDYRENHSELTDVRLGMLGTHQEANAAGAIAAVNQLRQRGWSISDESLRSGLAAARCPARIELVAASPTVLLDVAHNPASVEALLAVLVEHFSARRRILIFASSMDKDYAGMLRLLVPQFDDVIVTRYVNNPRAMDVEELHRLGAQAAGAVKADSLPQPRVTQAPNPAAALALAREMAGPDDLICITGSFFLAAELRPLVAQGTVEALAH